MLSSCRFVPKRLPNNNVFFEFFFVIYVIMDVRLDGLDYKTVFTFRSNGYTLHICYYMLCRFYGKND